MTGAAALPSSSSFPAHGNVNSSLDRTYARDALGSTKERKEGRKKEEKTDRARAARRNRKRVSLGYGEASKTITRLRGMRVSTIFIHLSLPLPSFFRARFARQVPSTRIHAVDDDAATTVLASSTLTRD